MKSAQSPRRTIASQALSLCGNILFYSSAATAFLFRGAAALEINTGPPEHSFNLVDQFRDNADNAMLAMSYQSQNNNAVVARGKQFPEIDTLPGYSDCKQTPMCIRDTASQSAKDLDRQIEHFITTRAMHKIADACIGTNKEVTGHRTPHKGKLTSSTSKKHVPFQLETVANIDCQNRVADIESYNAIINPKGKSHEKVSRPKYDLDLIHYSVFKGPAPQATKKPIKPEPAPIIRSEL